MTRKLSDLIKDYEARRWMPIRHKRELRKTILQKMARAIAIFCLKNGRPSGSVIIQNAGSVTWEAIKPDAPILTEQAFVELYPRIVFFASFCKKYRVGNLGIEVPDMGTLHWAPREVSLEVSRRKR